MQAPNIPAVSVIVPAYGVAGLVGEALGSLQRQTFDGWEAIVVDDGAPDELARALVPFAGDLRIRLLHTDHGGVAAARNHGVAAARAPLIALLDGDDAYEPDYLAAMKAAIEAAPGIGFVSCDATFFGSSPLAGQRFSDQVAQVPPVTLDRVLRRAFNVFTASMMRRTAFNAVGGYDPTLRTAEDFDLWVRLLGAGWGGRYVPRTLVRYRRRVGSLSSGWVEMLPMVVRVYAKAEGALAGRPEGAVAATMRRRIECEMTWEAGDAMIRDGRVREGLQLLRDSGAARRSPKWWLALPLMRAMPAIARPLLSYRWRQQEGL